MKLHVHYCPSGLSNCYILGSGSPSNEAPLQAVIIDPGNMAPAILATIEENDYTLIGILITHDHSHHVRGVKTIMKIYDTEIYAITPEIMEHRTTVIKDGDTISIGQFRTEVISIPGHSADSAVFKIGRLLFTGDVLSAGLLGKTASSYAAITQRSALQGKIFSLPGDYTILPGHGPPSSLKAERHFNLGLNSCEQQKKPRFEFWFD